MEKHKGKYGGGVVIVRKNWRWVYTPRSNINETEDTEGALL